MTLTLWDMLLYAGGLAVLWAIPGPVWVALVARALSGGLARAWPLALGVALGDAIWAISAVFGLAWILSLYGDFLVLLRWVAAGMFLVMGLMLLIRQPPPPGANTALNRPGLLAGVALGFAVVIGNPKAVLFYMGLLPGFFDLTRVTGPDIAVIALLSSAVPFLGNLLLALFFDRARRLLSSPQALRRLNIVSGLLLMLVGAVIPFA